MTRSFENSEFMRYRFRSWFDRVGARGDWRDIYREIEDAYRTPPRYYHNFHRHIAFCIRELNTVPEEIAENINKVEFALYVHDGILDFARSDNEPRSVLFSNDLCAKMGLPTPFTERVGRHILATGHSDIPDDPDSRLVVDIDLVILGQDEATFKEYERAIRKEYGFVSEDAFRKGRAAVLRHFLERPSIFLTEYFGMRYEEQARKNLIDSIECLQR